MEQQTTNRDSDKTALEQALEELGAARQQVEDEELTERLARLPDLGQALRDASPEVQRQVFEAFDVQIGYDKPNGRVEVSATVSEAVASALENAETLRKEGLEVVATDIAGARYVSRGDARIVERARLLPDCQLPPFVLSSSEGLLETAGTALPLSH
jgi:hypothetical protein